MKLSGNYLNIFLTYEIKFKLMHWREFADVQIKTVKTQKHLYCLVFTKIPTAFCRRDFLLVQAERFEKAVAKQRNSRWLFRRPCACRRARKRAERMNHLRQKSRRLFADGIFYWCGRRDSKRRLRSKETAGGCFDGRVRVGERGSEPSE